MFAKCYKYTNRLTSENKHVMYSYHIFLIFYIRGLFFDALHFKLTQITKNKHSFVDTEQVHDIRKLGKYNTEHKTQNINS